MATFALFLPKKLLWTGPIPFFAKKTPLDRSHPFFLGQQVAKFRPEEKPHPLSLKKPIILLL